ncbi:MAG: type II toxin-antitoxin system HicB family antitoxin [Azonexus sp.]
MNEAVPYKIKYEVYPEDGIYVARCLDLDVASDGATDEEALANLREAIELYFERNAEAALGLMAEDGSDEDDESDEADY